MPRFSVIIPAHNEAAVIQRCLRALRQNAPEGALEVIVVCNGCSDETASLARTADPDAIVIELTEGSKPLALNTGNEAASATPRFFVDADVAVSYDSLATCAEVLASGNAQVAAPMMQIEKSGCSPLVKAYYRVWETQPYVTDGMVGSGVFGLSSAGLEIVREFPPIIADDEYVRTRFHPSRRVCVRARADGEPVVDFR